MSTLLTDEDLVRALREIVKAKGVSLRAISKDLDVPYRSVQNYLGGETRIPASFFLNLCVYIGVEPEYIAFDDFRPREADLYDAIWSALEFTKLVEKVPLPTRSIDPAKQRELAELRYKKVELVRRITVIVGEQYDRYRREWLAKKDGGTHGRRMLRTLPSADEVDQ